VRVFCTKMPSYFCQSQNVTRGKLRKEFSYKKRARKMLMKLSPVRRRRRGRNSCGCSVDGVCDVEILLIRRGLIVLLVVAKKQFLFHWPLLQES